MQLRSPFDLGNCGTANLHSGILQEQSVYSAAGGGGGASSGTFDSVFLGAAAGSDQNVTEMNT